VEVLRPVTAEVAGSSPVVPAIFSSGYSGPEKKSGSVWVQLPAEALRPPHILSNGKKNALLSTDY
jgi:hypothetical protein